VHEPISESREYFGRGIADLHEFGGRSDVLSVRWKPFDVGPAQLFLVKPGNAWGDFEEQAGLVGVAWRRFPTAGPETGAQGARGARSE
jgi:hypothetical protein